MDMKCVLLKVVAVLLVALAEAGKIVDLDREKQSFLLDEASKKCIKSISEKPYPTSGVYCNRTWDTITCWPDVPAGTLAIQSCPSYFNGFNTDEYVTRRCLEDGTWFISPETKKTWSNYTSCATNISSQYHVDQLIQEHMPRIRIVLNVGYSLSLVSLALSLAIMLYLKKLHCPRNTVHINLFASFALRAAVSLMREHLLVEGIGFANDVYEEENGIISLVPGRTNWECKLFFTLFHYSLGSNYMWIFLEGFYLHMLIFVSVFSETSSVAWYMVAGWLSPLIWVIPWAIVRSLLLDEYCWNTTEGKHYNWITRGPITLTIVINFIFFLNILRVLFTKLKTQNTPEARKYRKLAKSTLVLIPLFGVHYIIFVGFPDQANNAEAELVRLYFEIFFNSFQGFMVSMMFCFLNSEVQAELRKKWRRYKLQRTGGQRSQKSATSMSTYLSKARNSLHSIHSFMSERKDSLTQKNGDSPPNRKRKRSGGSLKQCNGHVPLNKTELIVEDVPKHKLSNNSLIYDAIVEEEQENIANVQVQIHEESSSTGHQVQYVDTYSTNESFDVSEKAKILPQTDDNQNDKVGNNYHKHVAESGKIECVLHDEDPDAAKRLLTDEEILQEDLV